MKVNQAMKFNFKNQWYPLNVIRKLACKLTNVDEAECDSNEKLQIVIDAIVHGNPTRYSKFILSLNKEVSK